MRSVLLSTLCYKPLSKYIQILSWIQWNIHSYPIKTKYQWANRLDSSTDLASKLVTALCTEQTLLSLMKHKMGLKACHSAALFVAFRTLQSVSLLVKCLVQHKVWLEINEYRQLNFLIFLWRVPLAVAHYQVDAWVECLLRPRCSKK